jgi:hypothetical protein
MTVRNSCARTDKDSCKTPRIESDKADSSRLPTVSLDNELVSSSRSQSEIGRQS